MSSDTLSAKYAKWSKVEEYEAEEGEEDWRLSEAELKARREKKRDDLIQSELDKFKEIDEKLARAEKQPALRAEDYEPPKEAGSWSEGRERTKEVLSDAQKSALGAVEAVLGQLAADAEFQADVQRPSLQKAIAHWTNARRLPKEDTDELFAEDSSEFQNYLKPALAKISRLQQACQRAGIGVPMDAVLTKRTTIFEPAAPKKKPEDTKKATTTKTLTEAQKRAQARKDLEERLMSNLPEPEPFSWRKVGKQILWQFVFLGFTLLYFHFVVKPKMEQQVADAVADDGGGAPPHEDDDERDLQAQRPPAEREDDEF
mmetsp:Transcript_13985/g.42297  ORF Transcript_13985/g.42297 Transcript_13985/m.42297 type:complete len:315 (+) Transcript_13985:27-971(+)